MEGIPVFDFANPWVALIQIALFYLLPRLVGLVTSKATTAGAKVALLLVLTLVSSALTWLLDVAVASTWATVDWTSLVNVVVNAAITFALANGIFQGVIKPTGQAERDANSTAIQMVGPRHSTGSTY